MAQNRSTAGRALTSRDIARQTRDQQEVDDALLSISHGVSRETVTDWSQSLDPLDERTQPYTA